MNFLKRLISSVILVVIAAVTISIGGWVLACTLFLISIMAFIELTKAFGKKEKKIGLLQWIGVAGITAYYGLIILETPPAYLLLCVMAFLVILMAAYVFSFPKHSSEEVARTFFSFVYAPVMLSVIFLIRDMQHGFYIVWLIFVSSWISDTGAYCIGMLLGKHKFSPKISPKKSIEGCIGGILCAALVGGLYGYFVVERLVQTAEFTWAFVLIGALGSIISQIGDLAASGIKRDHEIKDYGKVIPGHGGIMDRFDSVIFVTPIIYLMALILL